ncbi:MAG: hypothetical protein DMD96_03045 [Candidatus Rokuibacteriota bacterium]|nr:MAG: hypothetical protein DMD96_03045 [Candidatus Rokubacteria bacterium]
MKHKIASWIASLITIATLLGMGLTIFPAVAEDDNKLSVPVAFGRGLNTNQQGNRVNHVIIPNEINAKLDGVVHFLVAGFHQVVVYRPGTQPEDIVVPAAGTFIDDPTNRYYLCINPGGGPLMTPGTTVPFSNSQNRVESVSFPASVGTGTPPSEKAEKGVYLVICNVRGHFLDGMFAFVKVQ